MAYVRKTHDEYRILGWYNGGWNIETFTSTREDARRLLREYRAKSPDTRFTIEKKRVPNAEEA